MNSLGLICEKKKLQESTWTVVKKIDHNCYLISAVIYVTRFLLNSVPSLQWSLDSWWHPNMDFLSITVVASDSILKSICSFFKHYIYVCWCQKPSVLAIVYFWFWRTLDKYVIFIFAGCSVHCLFPTGYRIKASLPAGWVWCRGHSLWTRWRDRYRLPYLTGVMSSQTVVLRLILY